MLTHLPGRNHAHRTCRAVRAGSLRPRAFFEHYFDAHAGTPYHNVRTGFRSYFLTFDDGARLEIMTRPGLAELEKPTARTGYAHVAFSVGSTAAVDALTARLAADGYEVLSGPAPPATAITKAASSTLKATRSRSRYRRSAVRPVSNCENLDPGRKYSRGKAKGAPGRIPRRLVISR